MNFLIFNCDLLFILLCFIWRLVHYLSLSLWNNRINDLSGNLLNRLNSARLCLNKRLLILRLYQLFVIYDNLILFLILLLIFSDIFNWLLLWFLAILYRLLDLYLLFYWLLSLLLLFIWYLLLLLFILYLLCIIILCIW
jgi:hypothetical protein